MTQNEKKEARSCANMRAMTFMELLEKLNPERERKRTRGRLLRLKRAASTNRFPFRTVGEYLDAGDEAEGQLLALPGIGMMVVTELRRVIQELGVHHMSNPSPAHRENDIEAPVGDRAKREARVWAMALADLPGLEASTRLASIVTSTIRDGSFPYRTIGEIVEAGDAAETELTKISGLGKKQAHELFRLIDDVLAAHKVDRSSAPQYFQRDVHRYVKRLELITELETRYVGLFESLINAYRATPDTDPASCARLERVAEYLLRNHRVADICHRRFLGETLESIGRRHRVTRERIRQIEKKYNKYITDIYSIEWLTQTIRKLCAQQPDPKRLPSNEALKKYHPKLLNALRHVFLPRSPRHGDLIGEERYEIAMRLGLSSDVEFEYFKHWTIEKVLYEVKKFAAELGKPHLMPMQKEFVAHDRSDLRGAITRFGGQSKVAQLAGLTYQGQQVGEDGSRTYWTEERIGAFLREVAEKEGHAGVMPTQAECRKNAPNPNTITTIITRGGWYGKEMSWFDVAKRYGLKYTKDAHKVTLTFVRAFVKSLGDALYSLTPSEIYVLFEQQGIAKSGKNIHRERSFDNLVGAMQSGYLPREEIERWLKGGKGELVEALLNPDIESVEEAFASVGRRLAKHDHKTKIDNPRDEDYQEDVEQLLPVPRAIDTLSSLATATDLLVHTSSDAEAVHFLTAKAAGKLWRRCFEDEQSALEEAKTHHGNIYSESARDAFLEEYTRSKQLPIPEGYEFIDSQSVPRSPKLMQRLIAYKVLTEGRVLNLSGTGTGKTLSAVLASRVVGARVTVIACPNVTVSGWRRTILSAFPRSEICEKAWEPLWSSAELPRYLIVNHEMFQNRYEGQIKSFIGGNTIDFVVIDELHQVKQRDESFETQRRRLLNGLITDVPDNRPRPRVLGMSATPIINNLQEGKSLIELVSSLRHDDIGTQTNVQNCMKVYQKFTTMGFRMMPKYRTDRLPKIHPVDSTPYLEDLLSLGSRPHPQQVEAVLVRARWPIIKACLQPKTVVFTDYVKDIVPYLASLIRQTGMSVGVYTGDEKLATELGYTDMLDQFIRGELQVLIASIKTVGTGVDGLQYVCNNVIFATLPWTNADYEQAIGRFDREGFRFTSLNIHIPKTYAVLSDGQEWSWCDAKLARLENKRDIAKAAVDGEIPDTSALLTPERATSYWLAWLKRLSEEGLSEIERREIRVPLDESDKIEIARRFAAYGDFSRLNALWNGSYSSDTHRRLQENPEEWCYYHTRLMELERDWQVIPRVECIRHLTDNLPRGSVIADFGCGQALLANALRDVHTVYSLDHIAINHGVTACDMAKSPIEDSILDAAVFSLSLMGTNLRDYIVEAYRTLKLGGQLLVYHPASNNDRLRFIAGLEALGFAIVQHGQVCKWHFVWAIKRGHQKDPAAEVSF